MIKNESSFDEQSRDHAEIYLDKITDHQSKYVAMHVGIFWGIGRFIIKNGDVVNIMLDSQKMFNHLSQDLSSPDAFIEKRTKFYKDLVTMRKLDIKYYLIDSKKNMAEKLLKKIW